MSDLEEIGEKVYNAMFERRRQIEIEGIEYPIKKLSKGIKYVDVFGYRYIEQNRNKKSEWGKKAREGHQIMWILRGRRYVARVMDGKFTNLSKKEYE